MVDLPTPNVRGWDEYGWREVGLGSLDMRSSVRNPIGVSKVVVLCVSVFSALLGWLTVDYGGVYPAHVVILLLVFGGLGFLGGLAALALMNGIVFLTLVISRSLGGAFHRSLLLLLLCLIVANAYRVGCSLEEGYLGGDLAGYVVEHILIPLISLVGFSLFDPRPRAGAHWIWPAVLVFWASSRFMIVYGELP